jgi:hypothetical protein
MSTWITPTTAPAIVAAEFHVGPIDGGGEAAETIDASDVVGDEGQPAREVRAKIPVHAPFVPQAPACNSLWHLRWGRRSAMECESAPRGPAGCWRGTGQSLRSTVGPE